MLDSLGTVVDKTDLILDIEVVTPMRNLGTPLQLPVSHDWRSRLVMDMERGLLSLFSSTAKGSRDRVERTKSDGR